jgi:hypothetical protein
MKAVIRIAAALSGHKAGLTNRNLKVSIIIYIKIIHFVGPEGEL